MLLSLTSIDTKGDFRQFSCWVTSLEGTLDVLSEISAKGSQLLKVEIHDEDSCITLPVEAFDGQNFSKPIEVLKSDWQQILSEPVQQRSWHAQQLIALMQQRIKNQQTSIAHFETAINNVGQSLIQLQRSGLSEPNRSQQLMQGELHLTQCIQRLTSLQVLHQVSKNRLAHLLIR